MRSRPMYGSIARISENKVKVQITVGNGKTIGGTIKTIKVLQGA